MVDVTYIQRVRQSFTETQYTTETSGTVAMANTVKNLIFIHGGSLAASITFEFPPNPVDGQTVTVSSGNGITLLSLTVSTGSILNSITTLVSGGSSSYTYISATGNWHKTA